MASIGQRKQFFLDSKSIKLHTNASDSIGMNIYPINLNIIIDIIEY